MAGGSKGPGDPRARTQEWLRRRFRGYYEATDLLLPDRFARREFGFIPWGGGLMLRHRGFASSGEVRTFLVSSAPMHAYYSSAYYERPGAPTMDEKGWLGADVVFDLDADHIPGSQAMPYPKMLALVKEKIVRLHDDFLVRDFGFEEGAMRIVFSGGRGYHIHVTDPRVWELESHERREIVDFIIGTGFEAAAAYREVPFDSVAFKGHTRVKKRTVSPAESDPGWSGKVARGATALTNRLETMDERGAIDFLTSVSGVTREDAESLYASLFDVRTRSPVLVRGADRVREGHLEALPDKQRDLFVRVVVDLVGVRLQERAGVSLEGIAQRGETDEPVTSDIKRLIRMPSTLHGKTGLAVVPLTRSELDEFDPLRDAVPRTWSDAPVRVRLRSALNLEMRNETFNLNEGAVQIPEYLAVFTAARGLGTVE